MKTLILTRRSLKHKSLEQKDLRRRSCSTPAQSSSRNLAPRNLKRMNWKHRNPTRIPRRIILEYEGPNHRNACNTAVKSANLSVN